VTKAKQKKQPVQTSAREVELEAKLAATARQLQESQKTARDLEAKVAKGAAAIAELEKKLAKPVDAAAQPSAPPSSLAALAAEALTTTDPLALQVHAYRAHGVARVHFGAVDRVASR
jgi:septal ring factor EnvC (AmiA/AmiB activator)